MNNMGKKDKEIKRLNRVIERLRRTNEQLSVDLHTLRRGTPAEKLATEIKYNLQDCTEALRLQGEQGAQGEGFAAMFEKHHTEPLDGGVTKVFFTDHPDCGVKGVVLSSIEDLAPDRVRVWGKGTLHPDGVILEIESDSWERSAQAAGKALGEHVRERLGGEAINQGFRGFLKSSVSFDGKSAKALLV
jgi:hypothetical protein